jgi:DNA-binding CsgD family transcriptional regulator
MRQMVHVGLTQDEIKVALLLIEGNMRSEILRKLHISAAEIGQHEKAIRKNILGSSDPDPAIAAIASEYKLTKRETDMLRCLRRGIGNDEIAAELFLSEDTVKSHVRTLMKKLPVEKRQDVPAWVESFGQKIT